MTTIRPELTGRKHAGRSLKKPPSLRLVYSIVEAGQLLGLSCNASYEAAKRGDIPTIRIGRRVLVPKAPFHRMIEAVPGSTSASDKSQCSDVEIATAAGDAE